MSATPCEIGASRPEQSLQPAAQPAGTHQAYTERYKPGCRFPAAFSRALLVPLFLSLLSTGLSGCTGMENIREWFGYGDSHKAETADSLIADAMDKFTQGDYSDAHKLFQEVRDSHPFTEHSLLAELKMADCKYFDGELESAATLYEEFESNHPTNEAVPYAIFQIGMSQFGRLDSIDRDSSHADKAIQTFTRLLRAYPQSPYSDEAKQRIKLCRDFLAGHELYVATFYIRSGEFKQAERRLAYLLDNYSDSAMAPAARDILAAIRSGNPPERTWKSWLPEITIPTWKSLTGDLRYGYGADDSSR